MARVIGSVGRVIGPVIEAVGVENAQMLELVEVGENRLIGEIVRLEEKRAVIQVYEDTTSLRPGAPIYGRGAPLSVELGPGMIGTIYDGIQRPLEVIKEKHGHYMQKGIQLPALSREKKWHFVPVAKVGEKIDEGGLLGTVQETKLINTHILVPPGVTGELVKLTEEGDHTVEDEIAVINTVDGQKSITMIQKWPVRKGRPFSRKMELKIPLITGQRVIDTLFPIAKGGSVCVPGGFGTGKTMVQQALAKWCDADLIVFIGCGERGNEITDVLKEFPELKDPRTGLSLMERTLIIANTSNMPVAAREASIYTGVSIAEFFRDMGYHVAVMADSTSRWAEALRELSGRMEEMPADEGFPAYLPMRLAEFYERAGMVSALGGEQGSVTIIGSVSPPGGDFSEPVTQHSKRFVRCFWALDRQLANARHYPSISWMDSYSEYTDEVASWWEAHHDPEWKQLRSKVMDLLQIEGRLQQVVKLVGPDVLPDRQRLILEACALIKNTFLQQNAFDMIDAYSTAEKQVKMLRVILSFYDLGLEAIKQGATIVRIRTMKIFTEIIRMKYAVSNDELDKIDAIQRRMERSFKELALIFRR
ncbi:MAG: V-type ATP synthase subunit A [Candidatus Theseobacter exili]|nr:V-type ATP synthase subunit A [Candidatus Theseobacter exili]